MATVKKRGGKRIKDKDGNDTGNRRDTGFWYCVVTYWNPLKLRKDGALGDKAEWWHSTGERVSKKKAQKIADIWQMEWDAAPKGPDGKPLVPIGKWRPTLPESSVTVAEQVRAWLDAAELKTSTRRTHEGTFRVHVEPYFKGVKLADLTAPEVERFLHHMRTKKSRSGGRLSSRVVAASFTLLRQGCRVAVKMGDLSADPCAGIHAPRIRYRAIKAFTPDEQERFREATVPSRYYALWTLLIQAGLRIGEALALRWDDLDGDRLRVERTLDRRTRTVGEPKTPSSRRTLELDPRVVEVLNEHRVTIKAWHGRKNWHDGGWMFPTLDGTLTEYGNLHKHHWRPLLERAGLPLDYGIHTLRHTAATTMLTQGVPVAAVSKVLGHASPATTYALYAHAVPGLDKEALRRNADAYFPGTSREPKARSFGTKPRRFKARALQRQRIARREDEPKAAAIH